MGVITRGPKAAGGNDFSDGPILSSEVNSDLNTVYTEINGELDEDNISASASIPNSSLAPIAVDFVTAHAASDSAWLRTSYPGDTATTIKPSALDDELDRLRWRLQGDKGQINAQYMNAENVLEDIGWVEPQPVGRNLLPNPGFEAQTGVADSAPDGWALVGAPTTVDIIAADTVGAGLHKKSLNIIAGGATEGISTVVSGLKSSTKYHLGIAYVLNVGDINIITAGGLLINTNYQDLAFNDTTPAGSLEYWSGIFSTNTSADDITVTIQSSALGDDFQIFYVWMYELSDFLPVEIPHIPMQTVTYTTADNSITDTGGTGTWTELTDLTISQWIPHAGYKLTYEVTLAVRTVDSGSTETLASYAFRIMEGEDGGADALKKGPFPYGGFFASDDEDQFVVNTVTLKYVKENPTPGILYDFSVYVYVDGQGATQPTTIQFNPTVGAGLLATQSEATLTIERL